MNVLFLGGGRRVGLAQRFIAAGCKVFGYELTTNVPLADVATVIEGVKWQDKEFYRQLLGAVEHYRIDVAVPLDDAATVELAFWDLPCYKVVSRFHAVKACYDKALFENNCFSFSLRDLYPHSVVGKPYCIKPINGCGSKDISFGDEWETGFAAPAGFVVQRRIIGDEWSVDAYFHKDSILVGAIPRRRLRVAGGEVIESITERNDELVEAVQKLNRVMKFRGPICAQFIVQEDGRPFIIECNARFGGGSTLSCEAGLDMVDYVLRDATRQPIPEPEIKWGLYMSRSYKDHYFHEKTRV